MNEEFLFCSHDHQNNQGYNDLSQVLISKIFQGSIHTCFVTVESPVFSMVPSA